MKQEYLLQVIKAPHVTEKASHVATNKQLVFKVDVRANKEAIREAVESLLEVKVVAVNTVKVKGKNKRFGQRKANRINKPIAGHFAKANAPVGVFIKEFRVDEAALANYEVGKVVDLSIFEVGQRVDVRARSIGKGFQGTIKRHNFRGQRQTHGNSLSHRVPGSIGQNQTPGRVFKGKKMSGHMGNVMCSVQNLEIVRIDVERDLILIKGAVPGAKGGFVTIRPSVKA